MPNKAGFCGEVFNFGRKSICNTNSCCQNWRHTGPEIILGVRECVWRGEGYGCSPCLIFSWQFSLSGDLSHQPEQQYSTIHVDSTEQGLYMYELGLKHPSCPPVTSPRSAHIPLVLSEAQSLDADWRPGGGQAKCLEEGD